MSDKKIIQGDISPFMLTSTELTALEDTRHENGNQAHIHIVGKHLDPNIKFKITGEVTIGKSNFVRLALSTAINLGMAVCQMCTHKCELSEKMDKDCLIADGILALEAMYGGYLNHEKELLGIDTETSEPEKEDTGTEIDSDGVFIAAEGKIQ